MRFRLVCLNFVIAHCNGQRQTHFPCKHLTSVDIEKRYFRSRTESSGICDRMTQLPRMFRTDLPRLAHTALAEELLVFVSSFRQFLIFTEKIILQ